MLPKKSYFILSKRYSSNKKSILCIAHDQDLLAMFKKEKKILVTADKNVRGEALAKKGNLCIF